ncbi:hypothetical protein GPA10_26960 [Streptomyces sp. p1417]|uniref:Uncharacterized protein n=1 Tax=Streptomyces typhae TaxID=2681492 RepID=A0A6L6X384_9ACTN|nr:hypothetical protein [Streptomyces typhae]MVO88303.1 hypothetical protein [Streptomyces typhae]
MGELVDAAVGWPGVAFSSAMAVVVCFWLLVALGAGRAGSFDEDADLGAVGLGGVPVAVAASLMTVIGWTVSLAGTVAVTRAHWAGLAHAAADVALLATSGAVAWGATYALVRLHAHARTTRTAHARTAHARTTRTARSRGSAPSPRDLVGSVCTIRSERVDTVSGRADVATPAGAVVSVEIRRGGAGSVGVAGPVGPDGSVVGSVRPVSGAGGVGGAQEVESAGSGRPAGPMTAGATALLYAYEDSGAFFWAAPCSVALAPGRRRDRCGGARHRRPGGPSAGPAGGTWPQADCA